MVHKSFTGSTALALLERTLRGRDDAFFSLLQASADTAAEAAVALKRLLDEYPEPGGGGERTARRSLAHYLPSHRLYSNAQRTPARRALRRLSAPLDRHRLGDAVVGIFL